MIVFVYLSPGIVYMIYDNCLSYDDFVYLSVPGQTICACAGTLGEYGTLSDAACDVTCLSYVCGNDVTSSVAVYRAYGKGFATLYHTP